MPKHNRECFTCGASYYYCPDCERSKAHPRPSWYVMFDCPQCRDIFNILTEYSLRRLSKADAQKRLSAFDLTDLSQFTPVIKRELEEILSLPGQDRNKYECG